MSDAPKADVLSRDKISEPRNALHPELGAFLNVAVRALMQYVGGDAMLIGAHDDDTVTAGRIARLGKGFVVIEQPADAAANRVRTFGVFRRGGEGGEFYRLSPERCLFMLTDQRPKGWHMQLCQEPAAWLNEVLRAMHHALAPFVPPPELRPEELSEEPV